MHGVTQTVAHTVGTSDTCTTQQLPSGHATVYVDLHSVVYTRKLQLICQLHVDLMEWMLTSLYQNAILNYGPSLQFIASFLRPYKGYDAKTNDQMAHIAKRVALPMYSNVLSE